MRPIEQEQLALIEHAYADVVRALHQLAGQSQVDIAADYGDYNIAYELLRLGVLTNDLFQAWDTLRRAYALYIEHGPPEPSAMTKFLALAGQVSDQFNALCTDPMPAEAAR